MKKFTGTIQVEKLDLNIDTSCKTKKWASYNYIFPCKNPSGYLNSSTDLFSHIPKVISSSENECSAHMPF